ncbi:hypothetical protein [Delftia phage PhiW-14]|uniref:Uncharacterized protein n=1 Tax=Delftia phage PhiW-14 TaxID=665032 RepID=C9DGK8_BPW14|nr:hypothetical protein DP-phiW-14_gp238 [Delftia phage PhiW-14]ACV50259.1 hypothetical protein [Delftia phage PhiW-14]
MSQKCPCIIHSLMAGIAASFQSNGVVVSEDHLHEAVLSGVQGLPENVQGAMLAAWSETPEGIARLAEMAAEERQLKVGGQLVNPQLAANIADEAIKAARTAPPGTPGTGLLTHAGRIKTTAAALDAALADSGGEVVDYDQLPAEVQAKIDQLRAGGADVLAVKLPANGGIQSLLNSLGLDEGEDNRPGHPDIDRIRSETAAMRKQLGVPELVTNEVLGKLLPQLKQSMGVAAMGAALGLVDDERTTVMVSQLEMKSAALVSAWIVDQAENIRTGAFVPDFLESVGKEITEGKKRSAHIGSRSAVECWTVTEASFKTATSVAPKAAA